MTQHNMIPILSDRIRFDLFVVLWQQMQNLQSPQFHIMICRWLQTCFDQGSSRLLLMAFRGSGKSTLVGLFCAWILARDPNLRIIVLAADLSLARKMVRNIKRVLERHPLTKHLKPKVPEQWAVDQFTVCRDLELRDPSVLARSVLANMTGSRADIIICDDVEVPNTCDTPLKRQELRERLGEIEYVLTPTGHQVFVGTPHHKDSIYSDSPNFGSDHPFLDDFARLQIPLLDKNNLCPWPEKFSSARIEQIKLQTGPEKFTSQMLLQPVNLTPSPLKLNDLQFYNHPLRYSEAGRQPQLYLGDITLKSANAWWDPAFGDPDKGDQSVIICVFSDGTGDMFVQDILYITIDPDHSTDAATQQCHQVANFIDKNYLTHIRIETNGLGQFLPGLLRSVLSEKQIGCAVLEERSTVQKAKRIRSALEPLIAGRRLYLHKRLSRTPLLQEFENWQPDKPNLQDDGLDALAGALASEPQRINRGAPIGTRKLWGKTAANHAAKTDFEI